MPDYWLVGAMEGGEKDRDRYEEFIEGRFWHLGYKTDDPNPDYGRQAKLRDEIHTNDLIAIKRVLGSTGTIEVRAVGRVTQPADIEHNIGVNWIEPHTPKTVAYVARKAIQRVRDLDAINEIFGDFLPPQDTVRNPTACQT